MVDKENSEPDPNGVFAYWGARPVWAAPGNALVRCISCGGGGWGDPFDRDPADTLRDVRDGYVSIEAAVRDYGVVVLGDPETDPEGLTIDLEGTRALRKAPRATTAMEPPRGGVADGLSVTRTKVEGACAECGQSALARYPVLAESGWFEVVKCQACLHSASRQKWNRLGYIRLIEDALVEEAVA
jgi:hypothetical protein